MPNTLRAISFLLRLALLLLFLGFASLSFATNSGLATDETTPIVSKVGVRSRLPLPQREIELTYSFAKRTVTLSAGSTNRTIVERIAKGKNPELIGAENHIRFLPLRLQPYLHENKVLFLSSERTRANNGSGQCGSGEELYLQVADISRIPLEIVSKLLVASCSESIELTGNDSLQNELLSAFSVSDGRLRIEFLAYMARTEGFTAELSSDFRAFQFR